MPASQHFNILKDIRFWLIFFFGLRLIGITNAPLETGHNWRQSFTNMVARNFYEKGPDLLHPMIDFAGDRSGIIGMEFPGFNFLIYLVSEVFGYDHWYGRLINLVVSTIGIYYFFRLIRELLGEQVSFNSSLVLLSSIWFAFSRKIMPDTFSVSLLIVGLYYGYVFLKAGRVLNVVWFFLFCTLGMLAKIPALSLFVVSGIAVFSNKLGRRRKWIFVSVCSLSILMVGVWYFYWVPHLHNTYCIILYDSKGIVEGFYEVMEYWPELVDKFYFSALHSHMAFATFLVGLILFLAKESVYWKVAIGAILLVFSLFILKTGAIFPTHNYYIVPFVPVMALIAGYGIAKISLKYQYVLLVFIMIEGIANQQHDFFVKESEKYKLELDEKLSTYAAPDDLIIINGGPSPQDMYFAHKKGWSVTNEKLQSVEFVESLHKRGAEYLVIDKTTLFDSFFKKKVIFEDQYYKIYAL